MLEMKEKAHHQTEEKRAVLVVYVFTFIGACLWLAAIFLAPWLQSHSLRLNAFIYAIFSPVCHQIPSRSLFFWGEPLAVCSRCLGIYLGFWGGLLFYPIRRGWRSTALPQAREFIAVSGPIVIDTAGNLLGLWSTSNIIRLLIGFIWGMILPYYFVPGMAGALRPLKNLS